MLLQEGPFLKSKGKASGATQVAVLTWRSLLVMSREWKYYWLRLIICTLLTLCVGTIFSGLGHSLSSVMVSFLFHLSLLLVIRLFDDVVILESQLFSFPKFADKSCSNIRICIILFTSWHCWSSCNYERSQGKATFTIKVIFFHQHNFSKPSELLMLPNRS